MAHALLTGGTGFIGSNLALRLVERGWRVTILQRPGASHVLLEGGAFEFVDGDVLETETVVAALKDIDVLFHAAGVVDYWNQGVDHMMKINVQGTQNVMQAALEVFRQPGSRLQRVVHVSSSAAMGIHPNQVVDESFTFNVKPERFVYGYSKFEAEQAVNAAVRDGLPAVIVNPTTVIGPRAQTIRTPCPSARRRSSNTSYCRTTSGISPSSRGSAGLIVRAQKSRSATTGSTEGGRSA